MGHRALNLGRIEDRHSVRSAGQNHRVDLGALAKSPDGGFRAVVVRAFDPDSHRGLGGVGRQNRGALVT